MNKKFVLLFLAIFSLGWFSSSAYNSQINIHKIDIENGIEKNNYSISELSQDEDNINLLKEFEKIEKLFSEDTEEKRDKISPYDWIKPEQILVYNDEIIIKIKNPEWAIFTDTKSMDPIIDSTANALELVPKSEEDIHTGDIVAYESKYKDGIVTHRVVDIGYDAFGWYAKLKGDNNDYMDPGKVRFEQIKRVVVGIIY